MTREVGGSIPPGRSANFTQAWGRFPCHAARMADEVRVEYRRLADLARWPRNPKAHDIVQLKLALRRWGFVAPLVEDQETGQLVAGHGRLEALLEMQRDGEPAPARVQVGEDGGWSVPVVAGVAFESEADAEGYLLADNRLVEAGGWDAKVLEAMARDFAPLDGTGLTASDVDAMANEVAERQQRGMLPSERKKGFDEAEIKQLVFVFGMAEYGPVLARLQQAMADLDAEDMSTLLIKLLDNHDG